MKGHFWLALLWSRMLLDYSKSIVLRERFTFFVITRL